MSRSGVGILLPPSQGPTAKNLGVERDANGHRRGRSCVLRRSRLGPPLAWLWLILAAMPASAQLDRIGAAVEFRAPDRPISAPVLGTLGESKSSDLNKLLATGVPTDVLKRIDGELSRTGTGATAEADVGRRGSTSKAGDRPNRRGLEESTFR